MGLESLPFYFHARLLLELCLYGHYNFYWSQLCNEYSFSNLPVKNK